MSANLCNAEDLQVGQNFRYNNRVLIATSVGAYSGTIKVAVEGYKFPLNLAPLRSLEIVESATVNSATLVSTNA